MRLSAAVVAGLVASVMTGAASAYRETVRLTAAGQADAHAVVITRSDLGAAATWTGGIKNPNLSSTFPDCSYKPKQSDLVVIGAAESTWATPGIQFDSESNVLQTPAMVGLDWKRMVVAPQVLPCLRDVLAKQISPSEHLISFRRMGLPQLATYSRAYSGLISVKTNSGQVQVMVDVILVGRGRTEITLTTTARFDGSGAIKAAELRLANLLVSRIRT